MLGVCGGYQLLGHSYELGDETIAGIGLLDLRTVRGAGPRLIGNIARAHRRGRDRRLREPRRAHASSAPAQAPLGRVLRGHGNDGRSGFEGARTGNVIGTYVHGPLLPKNCVARATG